MTITIKKRSKNFQPYQYKQMRLISYWSGLPVEHIKELIEEYQTEFIYEFK